MRLILASASPRRRALLAREGVIFEVAPSDVDESVLDGEAPGDYVRRVATAKAHAHALDDGTIVLAADTTVVVDGTILGKPLDADDAVATLHRLSGRWHEVITAVVVRWRAGQGHGGLEQLVSTAVAMRALDDSEIEAYVATGEPLGKAGSYAIQEAGGALVAAVRGSVSNVAGLPIDETMALLARVPGWCLPGRAR